MQFTLAPAALLALLALGAAAAPQAAESSPSASLPFESGVSEAVPVPSESATAGEDDHDHDHDDHDHGDHDHPEVEQGAYGVTTTECDAHGDHWHCPEGVEEPSNLPTPQDMGCEAHGDHWHCPEGVEEPADAPTEEDIAAAENASTEEEAGEILLLIRLHKLCC